MVERSTREIPQLIKNTHALEILSNSRSGVTTESDVHDMATNTEANMEEDSRTGTFELKRPHDDSSNAGSTKSTPRKRARRSGRIGQQDVRDFVPHGASFSTSAAAIGEGEGGKAGGVSHDPDGETDHASLSAVNGNEADPGVVTSASGPPTQDEEDDTMKGVIDEGDDNIVDTVSVPEDSIQTQSARKVSTPAWNWNSVNTVRIRTSLGGAPGKSRTVKEGEVPTSQEYHACQTDQSVNNENMVKDEEIEASQENQTPQEQATQTAFTRLEGFRDRLSGMDPHDGPVSAYQAARVEMENAEVDYNYCLYYPFNEDFSPPPRNRAPQFVKRAKQWKKICMWNQTKKCMKAGTLQDLKDGKIKVNAAELRRGDPSEPQPREMPSAALEDIKSPTYSEFPENFDSQKIQSFGQSILSLSSPP